MKLINKNLRNYVNITLYKNFKNTIYHLNEINSPEIIIHHHLGLGDFIICNGLINYLSTKIKKLILPVKNSLNSQISFLYSKNKNINIMPIKNEIEIYKTGKQVLRVGFEKNNGKFNSSFYHQLNLPFSVSFEYFDLPIDNQKSSILHQHLKDYFKVNNEYRLVHNESSQGTVDITFENKLPTIYVNKESDLFKNIFHYTNVIENAKEIHCIDSSFLHLVERIPTNAKLFFHAKKQNNQISEKLELVKNWNILN